MLFSIGMLLRPLPSATAVATLLLAGLLSGCKRSEAPPPDLLKTQRDAMEQAKDVGKTMEKSVDDQGRKADEEGR